MPSSPKILDVTVRDGGYLINHKFTPEFAAEHAKTLAQAGLEYAEISHGVGIGGKLLGYPALADDEELLEAVRAAAPGLRLSVFISPVDYCLPIIPGLVEFFEIGRLGLRLDDIGEGEKFLKKLKKYDKKVSVQLVRSHSLPPELTAQAGKKAWEMGADIVYLVDSFGSMTPADVRNYVAALKAEIPVEIGFHGHNNIGMAIPNTLAAWDAGATWLDASLMGMGRGAGNAYLETLVALLQQNGEAKGVDLAALCRASSEIVLPYFQIPPSSGLIELLFAREKLDYNPPDFLMLCSQILGLPLDDFLTQLHGKMRTGSTLAEPHIREVFQDSGVDFDKMLSSLKMKAGHV